MQALVVETVHQAPVYKEVSRPKPKADEVLIQVKAAALNHRDVYITKGLYPGIVTPVILGSDGAGIVIEQGSAVEQDWSNRAVIINPNRNWGDSQNVQSQDYHIMGMPSSGCFAEYVCVPADRLEDKPEHLSFEAAAALPLGGLTAYRALFSRAGLQAGERVLISGVGGGVAQLGCQMAVALGCEVWVTSGSEEKIKAAKGLGAAGGANYKAENWHKTLKEQAGGGFDVILDSAGGDGFKYFLDLANPAARIVFYGGTRGKFEVNPQKVFWKQIDLLGSTMGSDEDFKAMIQFVNQHQMTPQINQSWPLKEGAKAFEQMDNGEQFGKIILKVD